MSDDYYLMLGVSRTATASEIKARFRFLSHAYHPDRFGIDIHKRAAEEEFKRINEAYQILSDPLQRARYDGLKERSPAPPPQQEQAQQNVPSTSRRQPNDKHSPPRQARSSQSTFFPRDLPDNFHRPTAELAHKHHCQVFEKMIWYKRVALWSALICFLSYIVCLFFPSDLVLRNLLLLVMLSCLVLRFKAHRNAVSSDTQARKICHQLHEDTRRKKEIVEGFGPVSENTKIVPSSAWTPEVDSRADWAFDHEDRLFPTDVVRVWSFNLAGGGASGLSVQRAKSLWHHAKKCRGSTVEPTTTPTDGYRLADFLYPCT